MSWIGVDLDGTLAKTSPYEPGIVGDPVIEMVRRVKRALKRGVEIRIFTARVSYSEKQNQVEIQAIQVWCKKHLGRVLPITATKDFSCLEIWDDRAVSVQRNTGAFVSMNDPTWLCKNHKEEQ